MIQSMTGWNGGWIGADVAPTYFFSIIMPAVQHRLWTHHMYITYPIPTNNTPLPQPPPPHTHTHKQWAPSTWARPCTTGSASSTRWPRSPPWPSGAWWLPRLLRCLLLLVCFNATHKPPAQPVQVLITPHTPLNTTQNNTQKF